MNFHNPNAHSNSKWQCKFQLHLARQVISTNSKTRQIRKYKSYSDLDLEISSVASKVVITHSSAILTIIKGALSSYLLLLLGASGVRSQHLIRGTGRDRFSSTWF